MVEEEGRSIKQEGINLIKQNPRWTNHSINVSGKKCPRPFSLYGEDCFDQWSLTLPKRKGSSHLDRHGEMMEGLQDYLMPPEFHNNHILISSALPWGAWWHRHNVAPSVESIRCFFFFKSCSKNICVLFKSRIKLLMPVFQPPGRKEKGRHASSHMVTCSSLYTKRVALKSWMMWDNLNFNCTKTANY